MTPVLLHTLARFMGSALLTRSKLSPTLAYPLYSVYAQLFPVFQVGLNNQLEKP